jgi:hypothetical protein
MTVIRRVPPRLLMFHMADLGWRRRALSFQALIASISGVIPSTALWILPHAFGVATG